MAVQTPEVLDKVALQDRVERIQAGPAGVAQTKADQADMKRWRHAIDAAAEKAKTVPDQKKAVGGHYYDNLKNSVKLWSFLFGTIFTEAEGGEAFFTMLIGMALFKWGVLQGDRSSRFYIILAIAGYGIGIWVKMAILNFSIDHHFGPVHLGPALNHYGQMGVTLGHLGLICLALKSGLGRKLLAVFKAPGQMPMTAYVGQTLICCWLLFPGFGFGLWGRYGWADLMLIATAVNAALTVFCNLWMRRYQMGPFEWVWRWLSYRERPGFRRVGVRPRAIAAVA